MRRTTFAALLLAPALQAPAAFAQKDNKMGGDAALKADLVAMEKKAWEAWETKNPDYFRTFLADDAISNGGGVVETRDQILKFIGTNNCDIRGYSFDEGSFAVRRIDADAAILTYQATQDYACDGKPGPTPVWATTVYVRRKGRWQNMLYHETQAEQQEGSRQ